MQMAVVDYQSLPRKELQNLCKKHGIPANKTNSFMAGALTSISKVNKPNEFGSATPIALSQDVGNKSIPSVLKSQNNRGDFTASKVPCGSTFCSSEIRSKRKEPIEEDASPSIMDTHTEEFTGEKTKTEKTSIDDTTNTSEAENVLLHVASSATDDWKELYQHANQQIEPGPETPIALYEDVVEELCQQVKFASRKGDEYSLCCTSSFSPCEVVNDVDHNNKIYTHDEQTTVDMPRVDHLGREKHCRQDKVVTRNADEESLHCTSSSSPCLAVNVGDTHEDKNSTGHEERPIHIEGVDLLSQKKEIYTKDQEETANDPALLLSHERLEKHHDNDKENNSQSHAVIDDRKGLFAKEMDIDDGAVKHDQPCSQPPSCRGNDKVEKSMVKIQTNEISNRSSSSLQFFVCCDNGIKLFVDLENSSPSEWMKTHNYEFSFCQELDQHKHCEYSQLISENCPTICKVDVTPENSKTESDKLTDFQPLTSDFERFSDQNPATCSSKFLQSQNFGSKLPIALTKKLNVCRELRRTSSFLIPPHGANRGLSLFMTKKSSRPSSTFMSLKHPNNVSSSSSATRDSHESISTQINCLSESSWPIKTAPSKVQKFAINLGTPEKGASLAKYHPNTKTAYSMDEPASPHAFVEEVSVITPIKNGCRDVEMLDQDLHYYSTKSLQNNAANEHNLHLAEEDYQNNDKEVESVSQMNCPHNSQKQMHKKSLLQDLQPEENRIISRYKDDYKKSPFTKCLRGMKTLARAATLRADILARRRALPLVGNNSAYSQSPSALHNLPYQSQNVQEIKSLDGILRGEIGNKNCVSPKVYCEMDLCVSSIKRYEREDPVIFPSVYRDGDLSVSHLTPEKDPLHNVCNISMPLALHEPVISSASAGFARDEAWKSSNIIRESNPKLSEREYSEISPLVHQEKLISVYGLVPGKDLLQNISNISAPLPLVGPILTHVSTGIDREEERKNNTTTSEYNPKSFHQSFQPLAKKRFFMKALAESTERMQAQRTQHNSVNGCLSGQKKFSEKVPNNSVDSGYENQNRNNTDYLLTLNLINSYILEPEDGPTEKVSESQKIHQEQFKTLVQGKSKEKAVEVAKKKAFAQWNDNEIRKNTHNLLDLNCINSYILETEDEPNKRVSGSQKRHQEQFKTCLRGNSKEKAMKVAKKMAFVQRNEILNSKRGITKIN